MAVAQVDTLTPGGTIEADDIFIATIGTQSLSVVAGGTTVADVTAAVTAAWNASTQPEFVEITATDSTTHITLTAVTAGVDFIVTASTTEAGGGAADAQTYVQATTTANSGPNMWEAENFSGATVPGTNDTLVFEKSAVDLLYGIDQNALELDLIVIRQSFTGRIGLPRTNANGYVEYRQSYLLIDCTPTVKIGEGEGSGSGRIKLDLGGDVAAAITVYGRGTRADSEIPCVLLLGSTTHTLTLLGKADVGAALFAGEVAQFTTITMGEGTTGKLVLGETSTLTTINVRGGTVEASDNVTTINQTAGVMTLRGSATATTWTIDGGTAFYNSSGTGTTIVVGGGGVLDFRQNQSARTMTNVSIFPGGAIHDPNKTVTWTNGIDLQRCGPLGVTLNIGEHQTLTPSAI